ncbi:hypothetical protein J4730_07145 [Klebsiella pneumoniae]|uniref:Uncharacterized protein n=1 Tax=Klebsiella pneumoniae TaxID=573 RepID=A0A939SST8_KLEPN|nr:hypothetical protein [Klebsiella pneumoniae]
MFLGAGVFSAEPRAGDPPASAQRRRAADAAAHLAGDPAGACAGGLQRPAQRQRREADTFAKLLFGYGLLQLLFMLRLMPVSSSAVQCFFLELFVRHFRAGHHRSASRPPGDGFFIIWRCRYLFLAIWLSACCCCVQRCCWSAETVAPVDRETLLNKKEGS